jgi:hypothetical protein
MWNDPLLRQFLRNMKAKPSGVEAPEEKPEPKAKPFDMDAYVKERDAAAMAVVARNMDYGRYGRRIVHEGANFNPHRWKPSCDPHDWLRRSRDPHRWSKGR